MNYARINNTTVLLTRDRGACWESVSMLGEIVHTPNPIPSSCITPVDKPPLDTFVEFQQRPSEFLADLRRIRIEEINETVKNRRRKTHGSNGDVDVPLPKPKKERKAKSLKSKKASAAVEAAKALLPPELQGLF